MSNPKARRSITVSSSFERLPTHLPASPWLKWAAAGSVLVHLLLLALLFWPKAWREVLPVEPEIPAQIEILTGNGAPDQGAPPTAAPTPPEPEHEPSPPQTMTPPTADGVLPAPKPQPQPPAPAEPQSSERQGEPAPEAYLQSGNGSMLPPAEVDNPLEKIDAQSDPANVAPVYPTMSAIRRETGTVRMLLHIQPDGSVGQVDVMQSSGHRELDDEALATVRRWHFRPAFRDGKAVESEVRQEIAFLDETPGQAKGQGNGKNR